MNPVAVALVLLLVVLTFGCSRSQSQKNSEPKARAHEDDYIDAQQKLIKAHKEVLRQSGRMSADFGQDFMILGKYGWFGNGSGYFGAYSFYEPAFEQAKRGWFIHDAKVIEGNNELWVGDDDIKFTDSIIGYKLPGMYMSWVENGKHEGEYFTATIVGVKDNGRTAVLDKRAPHHAEQYHISIVPSDWQDLCGCTNNFHPEFVNGQPIVAQVP